MVYDIKTGFLLAILILSIFSSIAFEPLKAEENLPYEQIIEIHIDTSKEESKFQPIDIHIVFDNPCWVVNETSNSIIVGYKDKNGFHELESQVYDLNHIDENHIDACNIVFLIPKEANGEEVYVVRYSDSSVSKTNYPDHVSVTDNHYFYEPISGQIIDLDYYKIMQDKYIIYGVCQEGELLGNGMSNSVIKLKPNSTIFETYNAEQIASFHMSYSINPIGSTTGSQWAKDVDKSILIDGNLMVRVRINGTSPDGKIQTDNIYTYYYQPCDRKMLFVDAHHRILDNCEIKGDQEREGTYAILSTIKSRSATIEKMNIGRILPKIHFIGEDGTLKEYNLPTDPTADPAEWILSTTDDQDLGSDCWMCIDDPDSGLTHGLIFKSNTGFLNGTFDGIQVKASVHQHVKLPGLEADSGDLFAMKNAYELGVHDTILKKGTDISYPVEFITLHSGGYEAIAREAPIYKKLVEIKPISGGGQTGEITEQNRYSINTYIHLAPSFPLGSMLSAATGKNLTYLTVELYHEKDFVSSGSPNRLHIGSIETVDKNASFREKLSILRDVFDLKNSSIFKTIRFPDVEPGRYIIKVYKENTLLGENRHFIGFKIVDVEDNTSVHIFCGIETYFEANIVDQNNQGIPGVCFSLIYDNMTVSEALSDKNGSVNLKVPSNRKPYTLQVLYQGFLVAEDEIHLKPRSHIFTVKRDYNIKLYKFNIKVKDTLGLPPAVNVNPMVNSKEMIQPTTIEAVEKEPGIYQFPPIYHANYNLKLGYKSFTLEESVNINKDTSIEIVFPAEFPLNIKVWNSMGLPVSNGVIILSREDKELSAEIEDGETKFMIPPGSYKLTITGDDKTFATQTVKLQGDQSIEVITSQPSALHFYSLILSGILIIAAVIVILWKRWIYQGLFLVVIGLILSSLFLPWWGLNGSNNIVSTSTKTMLIPAKVITFTMTETVKSGEIASIPEEFTAAMGLIVLLLIIVCISLLVNIFMIDRFRRTSMILSIIGFIVMLLAIGVFIIAMSAVTEVGVGSLSGTGDLSVSIPGETNQVSLSCNWGLSTGFYIAIISLLILIVIPLGLKLSNRFKKLLSKKI